MYGKESHCFKENLQAIENSIISTSPCKFLVDYFGSKKLRYFSHAVNTKTFINKNYKRNFNLLCVANNGYAGRPEVDRKGFKIAIEAAMALNMPITIGGPKNNEKFFSTLPPEINNYPKLNKVFDLNEEQLIELYNTHSIFLHFSELEAGHPNLTLLEAMSCGLPIVGTFEEKSYKGMIVTERNTKSAIEGIKEVIEKYSIIQKEALENAHKNCYSNRVYDLVDLYSEYREKIFADRLIKSYKNTTKHNVSNRLEISYINGAKVEILGPENKSYTIDFIDDDKNELVYRGHITNNMWTAPNKKYFINWKINIYEKLNGVKSKLIHSEKLNLTNKRVKINLDTTSLGDLLAYIPVIDRFQKKNNCILDCTFFSNELLKSIKPNYPNINFISEKNSNNIYYAVYDVGYFMEDWLDKASINPRLIKLNHVPSYILGVDHREDRPKLSYEKTQKPNKKYICIGVQSTAQCKYWNNQTGWVNLIKFLNLKGYDVWCIDRHFSYGNAEKKSINFMPPGAIDKTGDYSLQERMAQIENCEFFIGLGSGLSWLAWAVGKPVVLISGFSKPFAEFETPYRIINENVCNGCWNDPKETFDKGDWTWCPRGKNFECTASITAEMVMSKINNLLLP